MLKKLDEFNKERSDIYRCAMYRYADDLGNGIECPKCGAELFDANPSYILASNPPKKDIECRAAGCDYAGYRIA